MDLKKLASNGLIKKTMVRILAIFVAWSIIQDLNFKFKAEP